MRRQERVPERLHLALLSVPVVEGSNPSWPSLLVIVLVFDVTNDFFNNIL